MKKMRKKIEFVKVSPTKKAWDIQFSVIENGKEAGTLAHVKMDEIFPWMGVVNGKAEAIAAISEEDARKEMLKFIKKENGGKKKCM